LILSLKLKYCLKIIPEDNSIIWKGLTLENFSDIYDVAFQKKAAPQKEALPSSKNSFF
tara:strand:+ start:1704 stop:1877 length:174 start_codon:yes stop_codon:yes gene_type:complete